jgi:hypothetical protein
VQPVHDAVLPQRPQPRTPPLLQQPEPQPSSNASIPAQIMRHHHCNVRQSRWTDGRTGCGGVVPDGMPSSMIGCSSMPASLGIPGSGAAASPRRAGGASAAASVPAGNAERLRRYWMDTMPRAERQVRLPVCTELLSWLLDLTGQGVVSGP